MTLLNKKKSNILKCVAAVLMIGASIGTRSDS